MFAQFLFFLGAILIIPFLPLLIWQGKRLRARIPELPEAEGPNNGLEGEGTKPIQLLVLGESTMAGVGVATQKEGIGRAIAAGLAQHYKQAVNWQVIARSGYNARQVREELVPQMNSDPLDIIIIGLSVNDTVERNSPLGWKRDLTKLIQAIREREPACPIVLIHRGPVEYFPAFPPIFKLILGSLIKLQWQAIAHLPEELDNFHIIKRIILPANWQAKVDFPTTAEDFFSDGVHPSKMTYELWAEEVVEFVVENGLISLST